MPRAKPDSFRKLDQNSRLPLAGFPVIGSRAARRLQVFAKKVGRGINHFAMIEPGDRILIAVSGGKDSLALAAALAVRRSWVPVPYDCLAVFIDWREYPIPPERYDRLAVFFRQLNIPLERLQASMYPPRLKKPFNCFICSRNRKRILFEEARRNRIRKIALGHHLDDIVETTLLNLLFRGEIATMMPVQDFFGGRMRIIRPMCEVAESAVSRLARQIDLPVYSIGCPLKEGDHRSQRKYLKALLNDLQRLNPKVRENIYRAAWRVNWDYLPANLNQDLFWLRFRQDADCCYK